MKRKLTEFSKSRQTENQRKFHGSLSNLESQFDFHIQYVKGKGRTIKVPKVNNVRSSCKFLHVHENKHLLFQLSILIENQKQLLQCT